MVVDGARHRPFFPPGAALVHRRARACRQLAVAFDPAAIAHKRVAAQNTAVADDTTGMPNLDSSGRVTSSVRNPPHQDPNCRR